VAGRRTLVLLLSVLVPLLVATVIGLVLLWPHGKPPVAVQTSAAASGGQVQSAKVTSTSASTCKGTSTDRLPDGSIPKTVTCATAIITITSGPDKGQPARIAVPTQVFQSGVSPGARIQVSLFPPDSQGDIATIRASNPDALTDGDSYAWSDFSRGLPLGILALGFALLVVAVARLRGLAALLGLGLSYLAIIYFMLPALRLGENAVGVALVGSIAVMTAVLYLAHGVSTKTTTALLGTIFGLLLTTGIAAWASGAAHLNGLSSETDFTLTQLTGDANLSGIILCGIIVAGLGVLNDVTITQASAVWEVHAYAPEIRFRQLFVSGMRVGRDHLASTVYTIAFAYAGAALPTLILIDLYQRPIGQVLTSGDIAEEIVRTLVGSIGLVLAIPVTTIVAALVVTSGRSGRVAAERPRGRRVAGPE
jgi:uncharacterized membrane protein